MSTEARRPARGGANARLLRGLRASGRGRPAYPALTMFKVFLMQQWYGLSDPAMEEDVQCAGQEQGPPLQGSFSSHVCL